MRKVSWALVLVAALFAGWSGWSLWTPDAAAQDRAQIRDEALKAGSRHIEVLNSMNPAEIDQGLAAWQSVSAGRLHDQLARDAKANRAKFDKSKTRAVATVLDAALTGLDTRAGDAKLIASVRVALTPPQGEPSVQRKRYEAGLERTAAGWKVTSLTVIPVGSR